MPLVLDGTTGFNLPLGAEIGVGTDTPGGNGLHVDHTAGATLRLTRLGTSTSHFVQLETDGAHGTLRSEGNLTLQSGGANTRITVLSTGNVGIGDSTPTEGKLTVRSDTNSNAIFAGGQATTGQSFGVLVNSGTNSSDANFRSYDQTGSTPYFIVRGDGNVGIGVASPGAKLDINGALHISTDTAGKNTFRLTSNAANDASLIMKSDTTDKVHIQANGTSYFNGGNVGIGTTDGDVTNDNTAARTYVSIIGTANRGRLNIGSTASNGADAGTLSFTNGTNSLADISVDTNSGVQNTGKMYINSTDFISFATAGSPRMRIASDGKVGIGTASPQQLLQIHNSSGNFGAEVVLTGRLSTGTPKAEVAFKRGTSGDGAMLVLRSSNSSGSLIDAVTIKDGSGNVGIGASTPQFKLHVNKGTGSYAPVNGITENVAGFQTNYDSAGSQILTFANLDGNWFDGTSGVNSAFGWIYGFQNNIRGGLVYDHRGTERMQLFSSYGALAFITADSNDGNGVPTDSNMKERLTIESGGKIISSPAIHIDTSRHTGTFNVTNSAEAYNLMMPSFYGSGSINQTYRHAYNISTVFHTTLWQGGGGNTVFTTWSKIGAEHHKDIYIETYTMYYSDIKIKVITDGNANVSVWYAGNTYNNNVYNARWRVYPLQACTITMNPSSSQSSYYMVHEASDGRQESSTNDASSGSGPSTW